MMAARRAHSALMPLVEPEVFKVLLSINISV
jgi:hypothetical protein